MELIRASKTYTDIFGITRCVSVVPGENPRASSLLSTAEENQAWAGDEEDTFYLIRFYPDSQGLFTEKDIRKKLRERRQRGRGRNATIHA